MGSCSRLWRTRCLPCLRRVLGFPLAVLAVGGILVLLALILYLAAPLLWRLSPLLLLLVLLLSQLSTIVKLVVEHVYSSCFGRLHLWMHTRFAREPYHTRFADLRIDVETRSGGRAAVHFIPLLEDNYAYLVVDMSGGLPRPACLVDPCDAEAVLDALPAIQHIHYHGEELCLSAILTTHKHWDHQGGNRKLPKHLPSIEHIYGGAADDVLGCTDRVGHGDTISVGTLSWHVIALPGHTRGCVAYCLPGVDGRDCLMTGDALFCGGRCGAPFEQCEGEEHRNLLTILRNCGNRTLLFPGHEYTARCLEMSYQALLAEVYVQASPGRLLTVASAQCAATHRRSLGRCRERLPTVPICLGEDRLLGTSLWHPLVRHADLLLAALEESEESTNPDFHTPRSPLTGGGLDSSPSGSAMSTARSAPPAPQPVVLQSDRLPRASPLVMLYEEDVEDICARLESGHLAGAEAAAALRAARERPHREVEEGLREMECGRPSREELCHTLRILGVPPQVSIGREAADLEAVEVHWDHLQSSLRLICGEEQAARLIEGLSASQLRDNGENHVTVDELAQRILFPGGGYSSSDTPAEAQSPGRRGGTRERATACCRSCLRGCRCILLCVSGYYVWRALRSWCCWRRRRIPLQELLLPPEHDVHTCSLCRAAWRGVPMAEHKARPPAADVLCMPADLRVPSHLQGDSVLKPELRAVSRNGRMVPEGSLTAPLLAAE